MYSEQVIAKSDRKATRQSKQREQWTRNQGTGVSRASSSQGQS